jgi:hypothetical protein
VTREGRPATAATGTELERYTIVPRYYFNVRCDGSETTDVIGEVCANDVEALTLALKTAGTWLQRAAFTHHSVHDGWIEIEDEQHREVMKLPLLAAAY